MIDSQELLDRIAILLKLPIEDLKWAIFHKARELEDMIEPGEEAAPAAYPLLNQAGYCGRSVFRLFITSRVILQVPFYETGNSFFNGCGRLKTDIFMQCIDICISFLHITRLNRK
jgi:hypothetical protein